jgi:photosystem I P700 chlorophyll a apoprotein A1
VHIKPRAQAGWEFVGQSVLNGDVGGNFQGIRITSGLFYLWQRSGITSELQLYAASIRALFACVISFIGGWFHFHKKPLKEV